MFWVVLRQSCLTLMCLGLLSILHCPIHYRAIVLFKTLQNAFPFTIVFATINNIKGNCQCIDKYISYMIVFYLSLCFVNNLIAACVDGTYGENCSQDCSNNCYNNICHVVSGLCLSGCRHGWMGHYCKQRKFDGPIL